MMTTPRAALASPSQRAVVFAASLLVGGLLVGGIEDAAASIARAATIAPGRTAASVARAPDRGRIALGHVNVLRGSSPGFVRVRVPHRAYANVRLDVGKLTGPNRWIDISGAGRTVGFALTRQRPSDDLSKRFLMATRMSKCRFEGCTSRHDPIVFMRPFEFGDGPILMKIQRGNYRLYLIADGAPVKITLKLRGLRGHRVIRPAAPALIDVQAPRTRVLTQGNRRSVYSAGSTYRTGTRGFFVSAIYVLGRRFEGAVWGMCAYNGPAPPEDTAFGPHCSALTYGGLGSGTFGYFSGGPTARGFWVVIMSTYGAASLPPNFDGRRSLGAWYASPGPLDEFGSQAFYLSYDR